MIPFRKSIGFRLLGVSFILLALPLLVDSFILIQQRYEHTVADAKEYLVEVAHVRELPLAQVRPLNKPLLQVISFFLNLRRDFPQEPSEEINNKLKKIVEIGEFSGIFLVKINEEGEYIVSASSDPGLIGKNYTDFFKLRDLFTPEAIERGYNSYITYDNTTLEPYYLVARLIFSMDMENPIGVLVVTDNVTNKLKELLKESDHRYPVKFALLLPSTVVFASTDPDLRFKYFLPLDPEFRHLFIEEEPLAAEKLPDKEIKMDDSVGYPFFEFNWKGEAQIGYIKELEGGNFGLLTYASRDAIFRVPVANFFNIYTVYGLILIIGGTIAYVLTMRMAKPIQNLSLVMQGIQKGDLAIRYKQDPLGFEINVLGNIFNEMVDAVLEQKKVAEEERVKRETLASELRLGQQVQRSLFPQKMPKYPGVDLAEVYIPAIEVGGDFYDVFVKQDKKGFEQLVLAVADASGKGVQACFYSLGVRNMLRTYVKEYDDVAMAMSATNNLFRLDTAESGMFVTVLIGVYDHNTQTFHHFSAGHNPAILWREGGTVEVLRNHGIAMGVMPTGDQYAESVKLNKGDAVILYTDGITEAHNKAFELYGEDRLLEIIRRKGVKSASELAALIVADVNAFVGGAPQHDDITLLVMKTI